MLQARYSCTCVASAHKHAFHCGSALVVGTCWLVFYPVMYHVSDATHKHILSLILQETGSAIYKQRLPIGSVGIRVLYAWGYSPDGCVSIGCWLGEGPCGPIVLCALASLLPVVSVR